MMTDGRFRLGRKNGTIAALQKSFERLDQQLDADMQRLIDAMKAFEGTARGGQDDDEEPRASEIS